MIVVMIVAWMERSDIRGRPTRWFPNLAAPASRMIPGLRSASLR